MKMPASVYDDLEQVIHNEFLHSPEGLAKARAHWGRLGQEKRYSDDQPRREKRFRWDVYHSMRFDMYDALRRAGVADPALNDDHIDTALRRIVRPLINTLKQEK